MTAHSSALQWPGERSARTDAGLFDLVLLAIVGALLGAGITASGLWPGLELASAERARALIDAPTGHSASDVATRALAAMFSAFGPSATAGRAASWAAMLVAVLAVHRLLAGLGSLRAARIGALLIATAPALAMRARFIGSDAFTLAALAVATCGLGLAALGTRAPLARRAAWFAVGAAGAFVAVASIGAGLARAPSATQAFDVPLSSLAHEMFPFSALVPLALGAAASRHAPGVAERTMKWVALLIFVGAFAFEAAFRARGIATPHVLPLAFVIALGALLGEEQGPPSPVALLAVIACALLLALDFQRLPEKLGAPFGAGISVPEAARSLAIRGYVTAAALIASGAAVAFVWRSPRARYVPLVFACVAAIVLRFFALEPIARAASPKGALDAFARVARPDERLALVGIDPGAARYAGVSEGRATIMATPESAASWLLEDGGNAAPRRFAALERSRLAPFNARYRALRGHNAPVLDGRTSDALLVTDRLLDGERSDSPLDEWVLDAPPAGFEPRRAIFGDALELVGWSVTDEGGAPASLSTGASRHVRVVLRVLRAFGSGHCTFLHAEHAATRFSDEHREWSHYPMALWAPGDVLIDDFAVRMPVAFRGRAGPVYYGVGVLPCADDRRMPLREGVGEGNRALLGRLEVR